MPDESLRPVAPDAEQFTEYDERHLVTYLRLLDADAEGAEWQEIARIVLGLDPECHPAEARKTYLSHLARARWMTTTGYRYLQRRPGKPQLS